MIVLINLLLILNTVESLNEMYKGTCADRFGRLVCCFNYEEVNGVCIACMHGFMNFDGGQCRPCSRGFYGINCLSRCHCNMNEKCDHVKGCLKVLHSTTEAVTEHDHVEGTTFSAVEPTTDTHSKRGSSLSALGTTVEIKGKTGIDDSKIPTPSIIVISIVLILLVFVSLIGVCWKYKVPCKKRKQEEGPSNTETSFIPAEENKVYFINQNG